MGRIDAKGANSPRVVVFDVFGVLLTSGFEGAGMVLAERLGRPLAQVREAYERHEPAFDLGAIDEREFWSLVQSDLGTRNEWSDLNRLVLGQYTRIDSIFVEYRRAAISGRTVLLSNTRSSWFRRLDDRFRVTEPAHAAYLSFEIGRRKPDREAFLHVCSAEGLRPSQLLVIDDQEENVVTASSMGAHAFHVRSADRTNAGRLRHWLSEKLS